MAPVKKCTHPDGCVARATHGPSPGKTILYCEIHGVQLGMRCNARNRPTCSTPTCTVSEPKYYFPDTGKNVRYCGPCCKKMGTGYMHIERQCAFAGCCNDPSWGVLEKTHCAEHKALGMRNLRVNYCRSEGCNRTATWGVVGKVPTHCPGHADPTSQSMLTKKCCVENCNVRGGKTDAVGNLYCGSHSKGIETIRLHDHIRCSVSDCSARARFRVNRVAFCTKHTVRSPGSVVTPMFTTCEHPGCEVQPAYGYENKKTMCKAHADIGMDPYTPPGEQCMECQKPAMFGHTTATHCSRHLESGMVRQSRGDGGAAICQGTLDDPCGIYATYGVTKPVRCATHRNVDDVVVYKRLCKHCDAPAHYGYPTLGKETCLLHIEDGMVRDPNKRCSVIDCSHAALFGTDDDPRIHCEYHRDTNDTVDLFQADCVGCGLSYVLRRDGRCANCYGITERVHLVKQTTLMNYLDNRGLEGHSTDMTVNTICSRKRPDRLMFFDFTAIIVECDENQHSHIALDCEIERMAEIAVAIHNPKTIFIRWNPDKYKTPNGVHAHMEERLDTCARLIEQIRDGIVAPPSDHVISYVQLFYDGWTSASDLTWHKIECL